MARIPHKEDILKSEKNPFQVKWLNSCYQQTLLPDAPWHVMEDKISQSVAQKVEKQFNKPERKEALIQVLGMHFVDKYLPNTQWNPELLEPPNMGPAEKDKIVKEAQAYLNSQIYKAVKDVGYQRILNRSTAEESTTNTEYEQFLRHTYNIFLNGMDRDLYIQESSLTKDKEQELKMEAKLNKMIKVPAPSRFKPASGISSVSSASTEKPNSAAVRAMVHKVDGDPPPLWGQQSDAIGSSIQSILQRDPRKFDYVANKMHGRQLPGSLRTFMWADVLFRDERKRMHEANMEKLVRERFAKAVSRGVQELKVKRATNSPISGLIETAVIETYHKTTSMVAFKSTEHMREASRVLNVLYVYDRSYEPYLIHWLFPIQIAFQNSSNKTSEQGEHVYELAMFLDLLNSSCFPTWPQVFAIAEQVMSTLSLSDPDLYTHLKDIAKRNVKINKKEFLVHLVSIEKAKAEDLLKATPGSKREEFMSNELLADPLVFLRRWIGEGFVSILDTPAVMYIWDQCFMQGWQDSVLKNFSLAILQLLRTRFMDARDYTGMRKVFLSEPCKLYTRDLQMAWIHLENGKDLMEIPHLNRQRPSSPVSRMSQLPTAPATPALPGFLNPCGIKDVVLKLVIPSEAVQREPWLATVEAQNLHLHAHAYFGSVKLRSRMSMGKIQGLSAEKDSYGNTVYQVHFYQDKFVFDNLDISELDVERELGAFPYSIIRVEYKKSGTTSDNGIIPIGWARIPLFQRISRDGRTSIDSLSGIDWVLQSGDLVFTLHPGEIPKNLITSDPATPSPTDTKAAAVVLGYNSELMAIVYDPRNEPPGRPSPEGTIQGDPLPAQVPPLATQSPSPVPGPKLAAKPIPTPRKHTPTPQVTPTPTPDTDEPWVESNHQAMSSNPTPTGLSDPFDFYIDSVRFIPDNASMVKVTGLIGGGTDTKVLLALPDLQSTARSPKFMFRLTYNEQKKKLAGDMIAFLRVYTMDVLTDQISVIGSCFVPIFKNGKLNVGGHQFHLRNGIPPAKSKYLATDLDGFPSVPAASILVRILPFKEQDTTMPNYATGYYFSEPSRPNDSERRIFSSYKEHLNYPKTVKEMIQRIQSSSDTPVDDDEEALLDWLRDQLDIKKLGTKAVAPDLPLSFCIRYRIKVGLNVKINRAYGLPDGFYTQCFAYVSPGLKVMNMDPTPEGFGREEKFVTLKHDFDSFQNAPVWMDKPTEMHPYYDNFSCLIIQVFGLDLVYKVNPEHDEPGTVHSIKEGELKLGDDQIIAWGILPLFEGNCVANGTHEIPLYRGKPPEGIIQEFTSSTVQEVIQSWKWNKDQKTNASLSVTLWDAHFDLQDLPSHKTFEYLLGAAGNLTAYQNARKPPKNGKKISNFVVDSLEPKYKKQGTKSSVYETEQKFFDDLIQKTFYDLMEDALMNAGYGPL